MTSPRERVRQATERWGEADVVRLCSELVRSSPGAVQGRLLDLAMVLGGLTDRDWLAGGKPPGHGYWSRVWAVRALLYVWDESAGRAVIGALGDEHWRVREMALKVVALRELGQAAGIAERLCADEVPRVRAAAVRALAAVGEGEHADVVRGLLDDGPLVARAAASALRTLSRRLDRDLG